MFTTAETTGMRVHLSEEGILNKTANLDAVKTSIRLSQWRIQIPCQEASIEPNTKEQETKENGQIEGVFWA